MGQFEIERFSGEEGTTQCTAIAGNSQCPHKAVPNGNVCIIHGGIGRIKSDEKKAIRNLKLAQWQARIDEKVAAPNLKNLSEEIGVLRITLESLLISCKTEIDLITNSHKISRLVGDIERTVVSCNKLDSTLGNLLDRKRILDFASRVMDILANRLKDQELILQQISEDMFKEIGQCGTEN